jgi:hypothetical protein
MNWKGHGRKHSWPNLGAILAFSWQDFGKPQKTSAKIASLQPDMNPDLPNKK